MAAGLIDALLAGVIFVPLNLALGGLASNTVLLVTPVLGLLVALFALAAFDGSQRGASPGKRLLSTKVVDAETAQPIGLRRGLLRRVVYFLGGLPLYAGWLWIFTNRECRSWHDIAARTIVVRPPPRIH